MHNIYSPGYILFGFIYSVDLSLLLVYLFTGIINFTVPLSSRWQARRREWRVSARLGDGGVMGREAFPRPWLRINWSEQVTISGEKINYSWVRLPGFGEGVSSRDLSGTFWVCLSPSVCLLRAPRSPPFVPLCGINPSGCRQRHPRDESICTLLLRLIRWSLYPSDSSFLGGEGEGEGKVSVPCSGSSLLYGLLKPSPMKGLLYKSPTQGTNYSWDNDMYYEMYGNKSGWRFSLSYSCSQATATHHENFTNVKYWKTVT